METLTKLVTEANLETFLSKHFTRIPYSVPNGAEGLKHILSWKAIEDIFEKKQSILRIVKDGVMTKDYAELTYQEALNYYNEGHTLLIKNAELSDQSFKHISEDFSRSFHTKVDVQLYCTPENHNAFGWHFDVEEVFIIQARGSKHYSIRPNTIHPNPLVSSISKDQEYQKEKSDVEIKVLLKEGDWLYIPSGWWHIARTQSESMHISIGLMPRSALDIASFLPKYLARNPFWRTRLPIHKKFQHEEEELAFYQDAFRTLGKDLISKMEQPEFIKDFLKDLKSE